MKNVFQTRILATGLAVVTLVICVLAALNFRQEDSFQVPTDGAWLVETQGGLRFERVPLNAPADRAGVRPGDILQAIDTRPTTRIAPYVKETFRSGIWSHATYSIFRPNVKTTDPKDGSKFDVQVILDSSTTTRTRSLRTSN